MDYNGARSKAIARLLKKLGVQANFECFDLHQYCTGMHCLPCLTLNVWVQRPYLVKGGFQAWSKNLRVKELKPETALTSINEVKRIKTRNSPVNQRIAPVMAILFSSYILSRSCLQHLSLDQYHLNSS